MAEKRMFLISRVYNFERLSSATWKTISIHTDVQALKAKQGWPGLKLKVTSPREVWLFIHSLLHCHPARSSRFT
jgi:hypothetical protein